MDDPQHNGNGTSEQEPMEEEVLLAEREAILRQLAEIGEDISDSDNEEDRDEHMAVDSDEDGSKNGHCVENMDESPILNADEAGVNPGENLDHDNHPIQFEKIVLDNADDDESLPLPEGWTIIAHTSGMPVYYHKYTRVATLARPYNWEGIVRDHAIPICAIPCLFRKRMNNKRRQLEENSVMKEVVANPENPEVCPESKIETMGPEEFHQYCSKLFKFKKVTVLRNQKPAEKMQAAKERRTNAMLRDGGFDMNYEQLKNSNGKGEILLTTPDGIPFIDLTYIDPKKRAGSRKPYLMNPMGKTSVVVLNEFVQRLVRGKLGYEFHETRTVSTPYQATATLTIKKEQLEELAGQCKESLTVLMEIAAMNEGSGDAGVPSDMRKFPIGRGVGCNKKTARLVAATAALSKLIPKLRVFDQHICDGILNETKNDFETEAMELFKKVNVDSQNVVDMCTRFALPKPYALLKDAVSRSVRWNGMELRTANELVGEGKQMSKVTLTLGDLSAEAEAIGVKQATQLASQLLLKKMHPEVLTYGGFLEMYGRFEDKTKLDFAKRQHDEVVRLQDTGNLLKPNFNVLSKLAEEMKAVSLVHPPRKFLYGLSPDSAEVVKTQTSVGSQCHVDDLFPQKSVPYPQFCAPPPPPPPSNFPMTRIPAYQPFPNVVSSRTHQNGNPRKRFKKDEHVYNPTHNLSHGNFTPGPPPPSQGSSSSSSSSYRHYGYH